MNRIATAGIAAAGIAILLAAAGLLSPRPGEAAATTAAAPTAGTATTSPPPPEEAFNTECSACHMAYPPGLLPVRSWLAIMGGLSSHFGENASLDETTATAIADFLFANSADAVSANSQVLRGLKATDVPLRITDTPWWQREHDEIADSVFARASVKSKSNCLACHGNGSGGD